MFGIFKMKALLIGMFLASPAFAVWTIRGSEAPAPKQADDSFEDVPF